MSRRISPVQRKRTPPIKPSPVFARWGVPVVVLIVLVATAGGVFTSLASPTPSASSPASPPVPAPAPVAEPAATPAPRLASIDSFRAVELGRAVGPGAPPLNASFGPVTNTTRAGRVLYSRPVSFDAVNWVNASPSTFPISARLVSPVPFTTATPLPAIIVMHGLNGAKRVPWAEEYATRGFVALTYDHPGHGASGGPKPNRSNFGTTRWNETEHAYLLVLACVRAITLLEQLPLVNASSIYLTGDSYGGITTMLVSGVYHDHVAAGIPMIAAGDFESSFLDRGLLVSWVFGSWNATWWGEMKTTMDPLYCVQDPRCPPQLLLLGTTDDYFSLDSARTTLAALGERGAVLFNPNGHHGVGFDPSGFATNLWFPTVEYWLDAVNCSRVPVTPTPTVTRDSWLLGETPRVTATLPRLGAGAGSGGEAGGEAGGTVTRVECYYRYTDVVGEPWRHVAMTPVEADPDRVPGDNQTWTARVPGIPVTSNVEVFVQVHVNATGIAGTPVFSSQVESGLVLNYLHPVFLALVGVVALAPVVLFFRRRWQALDDYVTLETALGQTGSIPNDKPAVDRFVGGFLCLLVAQGVIFSSFTLDWVVIDGRVGWTGVYLFDTYFSIFAANLAVVFLLIVYAWGLVTLKWPRWGALANLVLWGIAGIGYFVVIGGFDVAQFGGFAYGPGYWVFLGAVALQLAGSMLLRSRAAPRRAASSHPASKNRSSAR